uniref:LEM domain-containing protein n=1 Tax=Anopheles dirus TaxID=7168 RepID=A0A182NLY4_9DIPT
MSGRRPAVADVLEELSNDEIRRQIVLHGGPNLPITEQTRGRLLQVLREYLEQSQNRGIPSRTVHDVDNESKSSNSAEQSNNSDEPASPQVQVAFHNEIRQLMILFACVSLITGFALGYLLNYL